MIGKNFQYFQIIAFSAEALVEGIQCQESLLAEFKKNMSNHM